MDCQGSSKSLYSRAFRLFKGGKNLVDIAINLDIETVEVLGMYSDYLRLLNLQKLMTLYWEMEDDIYLLEHLYLDLKNEGLCNKQDIFNIAQMAGNLKSLNCELYETAEDIGRLNSAKFQLERDVEELQKKADHFDALLLERGQYQRLCLPIAVLYYFGDYLRLVKMGSLVNLYNELRGDLSPLLHLYRRIKKEGLSRRDIGELLETQHLLLELRKRVDLYNSHIWGLHEQKIKLGKEIAKLSEVLDRQ